MQVMFLSPGAVLWVSELNAIKDDLSDDFYRSVGASVNTLLSLVASLFFVFRLKLRY